ncbi:MAG: hypothetical protein PF541_04665 [Prolixibacteraceae bacterium]|jgi:hypothetical protein|nr:hypothetical protein [Prolixibacteraceae bacterium]
MKRLIIILFVVLTQSTFAAESKIDSLLVVLEQAMDKRDDYDKAKEFKIAGLKASIMGKSLSQQTLYLLNKQIIAEYQPFNFDSTIAYVEKNRQIAIGTNNTAFEIESIIHLSELLATSGRYKESIDILESINENELSIDLIPNYYQSFSRAFHQLANFSSTTINQKQYEGLSQSYTDSLLNCIDSTTSEYLSIIEGRNILNGKLDLALEQNSVRMGNVDIPSRDYSIITYYRSQIF